MTNIRPMTRLRPKTIRSIICLPSPCLRSLWFEASGLPEEAFSTAKLIKTYLQHNTKIHAGQIFPIGNEPNGKQWTGFQSIINVKEGYILVFREDNTVAKSTLKTWLSAGQRVHFTPVAGRGKAFDSQVLVDGSVLFGLAHKNSFALYKYSIK